MTGSPRRIPRLPRAFTLIEVVASVALATALLMVLLTVASSVQVAHRRTATLDRLDRGHAQLLDLLRHDLAHATQVDATGGRLRLACYGGFDEATLEPNHLPRHVVYTADPATGLLLREETDPASRSNRGGWVDVVAAGVAGFTVAPAGPSPATGAGGGSQPSARPPSQPPAVPDRLRVRITWNDGRPAIDRILLLR